MSENNALSPQELELIEILIDPVRFAKYHFDWEARWYQKEMLRSKAIRKVSRCGRRIGKTDVLCVHALWYAFTNENAVVLVATPYESQVKLIFKRIREFLAKSEEISSSVVQNTKHPEYIQFGNGSVISGFTAGTRSGAEGGSMRGQRADWIILDETDYLSDGDIYAISSIAIERPDIGIWASSTPTGKRGKFYEYCMDAQKGKLEVKPGKHVGEIWTEFYYPSTVLPSWSEEMAKEWRMNLDEDAWEHEVMANFGQETIGVFNKEFIDRAKKRYAYVESVNYKAVRVMGVDWDKYSSTPQIIVLEYDPTATNSHGDKGMFKVIMRDSVPRSDFTLDNAVNKIVEFNGIYRPAYIYVDRGFGEYQLEILHKKGKECKDPTAPEFGLDKIAKGIHFGSKIDLRDPGTGEVVKKDVKPFMVSQTNILLERDRIILNENDKVLWRQMENYQVVKVSVDGKPTYTSVNEHALDALMLSVLAMTLEFPELAKIVQKFEPNRSMALASAIPRPEASFGEKNRSNQEEKEYFMTSRMRENNSQTWNKVDDLRKSKRDRRGGSFMRGTIAPRGRGQKKPFSRPKF